MCCQRTLSKSWKNHGWFLWEEVEWTIFLEILNTNEHYDHQCCVMSISKYIRPFLIPWCNIQCIVFNFVFIGPPAVAGRVLWIRVCPSFCPSVLPSESFLGIGSLVFSETQHGVRGQCVVRDRAGFFFNLSQKWGKWSKNRFLGFIGKFSL